MTFDELSKENLTGKVSCFQTDTILGLSALIDDQKSIENIKEIKQRECKGFIVLISSLEDLKLFDIELSDAHRDVVSQLWPGPVTIVLTPQTTCFPYLRDAYDSIAFRIPNSSVLQEFLRKTGPLVSTSVNISGEPSIVEMDEAKKKFGDAIDVYIEDVVEHTGKASTLVSILR